jgi:hypothetical protein
VAYATIRHGRLRFTSSVFYTEPTPADRRCAKGMEQTGPPTPHEEASRHGRQQDSRFSIITNSTNALVDVRSHRARLQGRSRGPWSAYLPRTAVCIAPRHVPLRRRRVHLPAPPPKTTSGHVLPDSRIGMHLNMVKLVIQHVDSNRQG